MIYSCRYKLFFLSNTIYSLFHLSDFGYDGFVSQELVPHFNPVAGGGSLQLHSSVVMAGCLIEKLLDIWIYLQQPTLYFTTIILFLLNELDPKPKGSSFKQAKREVHLNGASSWKP